MSLFQNSVLKKYLRALDHTAVESAWQRYTTHFFDPQYQHNVRAAKEEQYQEGFLRDLFVNILGYTLHPKPGFDLTTELKNIRGAKKTDGAILQDGHAVAVIELKGTDTVSLDKIEDQAFGYKRNQTNCTYVITSNFEKLRFYIDDSIDFIDFPLFQLTKDEFDLLYLCLSRDSIRTDLPKRIKSESVTQEEAVTKQLYKDYSAFRREIFDSIVQRNPEHDKLTLFKSTQKLLDRFLFIFFAEDRGLLPPNSIRQIIVQWTDLRDKYDEYTPLYERFKKYFGYLNTGHKGAKHEIFAYNGGLFAPDDLLDSILIDDDILYAHTQRLSDYDFESEVSVNILGHIFEHSLNEIEEIQSELEGQELDKAKTKRKKDGVFYTPKYITKYIVDNTVGQLCNDKKSELKIDEAEYDKDRKGRTKKKLSELQDKLEDYRSWLLTLTICDPACGSGAFLNQALEYLIAEHQYIDTLQTKLLGGGFAFPNVENAILEHNLYGVDINQESVEIAKLSLWLRTAERGRKLTSLNDNIKCGNSLIDDPEVAGDKAFKWEEEFPEVFEKGGFDVVIGNPPYLRVQGLRTDFASESIYYETKYKSATGRFDIYVLFIERTLDLINDDGKISMILPHKFMVSDFGEGIRGMLVEQKAIESIDHFESHMVFDDASTYTCILGLNKEGYDSFKFRKINPSELFDAPLFKESLFANYNSDKWSLQDKTIARIFQKLGRSGITVKDLFTAIRVGIDSGDDDMFQFQGQIKGDLFHGYSIKIEEDITIESELVKPILKGENVKKYSPLTTDYFMLYPHFEIDGKTKPIEETILKEKYPLAYSYLSQFKEDLMERKVRKKTNPKYWYSLHRSREMSIFEAKTKIITPEISLGTNMTLDSKQVYFNTKCYGLLLKDNSNFDIKYLLSILNSKIMWFFMLNTGYVLRGGFFTFKTKYLEPFPIPEVKDDAVQVSFINRADELLQLTTNSYQLSETFLKLLQSKYSIDKLSKKLESWYDLDFGEFLAELKKKKIKLSLQEEAEWMPYFEEQRAGAQEIRTQIDRIDAEIDQMVYQLYGLTEEEIAIVEEAVG